MERSGQAFLGIFVTVFCLGITLTPAHSSESFLRLPICTGRRIFTLPLPSKFNTDLTYNEARDTPGKEEWFTAYMLKHLERARHNLGLGRMIPSVMNAAGVDGSWYQTDQNSLEIIFYARMLQYTCRVDSHQDADLIYIPYFGGHDSLRHMHMDTSVRDKLGLELVDVLKIHPAWSRRNGSDFFMVLGRNLWDFLRGPTGEWGSDLFNQEGVKDDIWTFVVEGGGPDLPKVVSVPKPTGFHPRSQAQLSAWQAFVKQSERKWLFSFVGGHRGLETREGVFREKLFWQCAGSSGCSALDCSKSECHDLNAYFQLYMESDFCLHPIGDSCTRRSVLDAALAGCIPVVFRGCTLEQQFHWNLGTDKSGLFVYIPLTHVKGPPGLNISSSPDQGNGFLMIEEKLRSIPAEEVAAMRKRIIDAIPRIIYGGTIDGDAIAAPDFNDGIDVIIDGLADRVPNL